MDSKHEISNSDSGNYSIDPKFEDLENALLELNKLSYVLYYIILQNLIFYLLCTCILLLQQHTDGNHKRYL